MVEDGSDVSVGVVDIVVQDDDTARAIGSGDVPVLATPRLIALMELAARRAVDGTLPPEMTTVGTEVAIEHLAPSAIGTTLHVRATLSGRAGSRLTFEVVAVDAVGSVLGQGIHRRAIVDRATFIARLPDSESAVPPSGRADPGAAP